LAFFRFWISGNRNIVGIGIEKLYTKYSIKKICHKLSHENYFQDVAVRLGYEVNEGNFFLIFFLFWLKIMTKFFKPRFFWNYFCYVYFVTKSCFYFLNLHNKTDFFTHNIFLEEKILYSSRGHCEHLQLFYHICATSG
jgi:hypothetical protein